MLLIKLYEYVENFHSQLEKQAFTLKYNPILDLKKNGDWLPHAKKLILLIYTIMKFRGLIIKKFKYLQSYFELKILLIE